MKTIWYLYHPESDCVWIEMNKSAVNEALYSDGLVHEITYTKYLELLNLQDELDKSNKVG